jgi:hypothetical protein
LSGFSITFENIPCDQAILEIVHLPKDVGADTLWALGYEAYGSLSPIVQKLAESLAATHYQPNFARVIRGTGRGANGRIPWRSQEHRIAIQGEQCVTRPGTD